MKKVRGKKRKMKKMKESLTNSIAEFSSIENDGYWSLKLQTSWDLLKYSDNSLKMKKKIIDILLKGLDELDSKKEFTGSNSLVIVTLPDLFASEICVFNNENNFRSFFEMHDRDWEIISKLHVKEFIDKFKIPSVYSVEGFYLLNEVETEFWIISKKFKKK